MQWVSVTSSDLSAVAYEDSTATLFVQFHSGGAYSYSGVPRAVYDGLLAAGSKGQYFHAHIKDRCPYQRL